MSRFTMRFLRSSWIPMTAGVVGAMFLLVIVFFQPDHVRMRATLMVNSPSWAQFDSTIRDYLALITQMHLSRELSEVLKAGRKSDSGISVEPASKGSATLVVEFKTGDSDDAERLFRDASIAAERRLIEVIRRLTLERVAALEATLTSLEHSRRFGESLGEGVRTLMREREQQLRIELDGLQSSIAYPDMILRHTKPQILITQPARWNKLIIVLVYLMAYVGIVKLMWSRKIVALKGVIERDTDVPVLGLVPSLDDPLDVRARPFGRVAEVYRNIRTHVTSSGARRIVCIGSGDMQGTSEVVANLALIFAEEGSRVLVVDGDLRKPTQHFLFDVSNDMGLTDVLIDTPLQDAVWDAVHERLKLLAAGPRPPDPCQLLDSGRFPLVTEAAGLGPVERVIVDLPPLSVAADVVSICPHADAIVLVADLNTAPDVVLANLRALNRLAIPILGLVLTNAP